GELKQQAQGFVGDPVLGIVEIDARGLDHEFLTTLAILGKELPQLNALDLLMMLLQQRPGRAQGQSRYAHGSFSLQRVVNSPCESRPAWNRCKSSSRSRT